MHKLASTTLGEVVKSFKVGINTFCKVFVLLFLLVSFSTKAQSPPACTFSVTLPHSGTYNLTSGQVMCITGSGTFNGSITVNSGAHLVHCGTGGYFGTIYVAPGGTYWKSPSTGFTGSITVHGTQNTNASNCSSCSTLNAGSIGSNHSICYNGDPSNLTNGSSASGGDGSFAYQWQYSATGTGGWTNISGATGTSYNPPSGLTADRWYRRRVISCGDTEFTSSVKVTVYADLDAGSIGAAQSICYGATPSGLTQTGAATGGTGSYTYQWQSSTDNATWGNISGATSATYSPGALTTSTYYRRAVTSGSCGTDYTSSVLITVYADLDAGSIGAAQSICYGATPSGLTQTGAATGGTGSYTYQWQSSTDNATWGNISGATSATYSPGALTTSTYYRRAVTSGSCGTDYTSSILITVYADLDAGAVDAAQTICYGATPAGLTETTGATGGTGSYTYQWQSSTDNATWGNISGATSATYSPGALTTSTYYRRAVTSGSCGTDYTASVLITVYADLDAGAVDAAQTICYGATPSGLTETTGATGGTGSYTYQWQSSTDNATWGNISGATSATYSPGALTTSTYYRRAVTSGSCGTDYTSSILITVYADLDAGAVDAAQTICYGATPAGLTETTGATGGTGSYTYQWQSSTDNATWGNISGATSATYSPGALTTSTYYRRAVTSGSCGTDYTASVLITVYADLDAGAVDAAQTICYGATPSGLTETTGATGGTGSYTYQWQSSTDNATWGNISGATSATYSPGALTTSTYYRRAVTSGSCGTDYTASVLITVYADLDAGAVDAAQTICYGATPSGLTETTGATGGTGSYTYQWQSSTDNATWGNISGATSATYSPGALTTSTYYRRAVTSGSCGTDYTASILITVYADLDAGAIDAAQTICYGATPAGLTETTGATGGTGSYTYQWQSSTDNATWGNISGATSATYSPGALTTSTYYRRAVTSGSCGTDYTASILITVYADLDAGAIDAAQTICYGTTPSGLTETTGATGGTGSYTYQWQSSTDNATWSNIGGATSATYSPGVLTTSTYYRRAVTSGSCGTDYTSSILITVYPDVNPGTIASDQSICYDTDPANFTSTADATGGDGVYAYQWQWSPDGSTSWTDITGATSASYDPSTNLTVERWYRRQVVSCGITKNTSTVKVSIYALPVVDLGNDTAICADKNITFDAVVGASWLWNTGATSQTINVNYADTFDVAVTDGNGCVGYDTIVLSINALPTIDPGNDTSICADANITFDAGPGFSYLWMPGGQITQTITVNTAATYIATITDINGCMNVDSVVLGIDTLPVIDLGNDTAICADSSIVFDAGVGYATYAWTPDLEITRTITKNLANTYGVTVVDSNGCSTSDNITLSINALPVVDLGNDTSICADKNITFDAEIGASWLWNTSDVSQTINVNYADTFDVVVTDANGCVGYDTIVLAIDTLPVVFLGNDTSVCIDSTLTLDAGNIGAATYLWSTTELTRTINVNTASSYDVVVTNTQGCIGYDTINLGINALPVVDLGNDTSVCADSTLTLDAGNITAGYLWNTLETTQEITINTAGVFDVIVTDTNGCVGYDTLNLAIDTIPIVDLGRDTSVCADASLTLDAGSTNAYYLWNTGDIFRSITVNYADTFDVRVTSTRGCVGYDTLILAIDSLPIVELGNDTSVCADSTLTLDAGNVGAFSYLWNTAEITKTITINTAGYYDVTVTTNAGCIGYDTLFLSLDTIPVVDLGEDTSVCADASLTLDAGSTNAYYLWNTGDIFRSITVNYADTFDVRVTSTRGCVGYDTLILAIDTLPIVDLGNDTSVCFDSTLTLFAGNDGALSYLWNTSETDSAITINTAGSYDVAVTSTMGCIGYDTLVLAIDTLPVVDLGSDTSVCADSTITLDAANKNARSYLWNTGDITSTINVNFADTFDVVVTTTKGCVGYDTLVLSIDTLPVVFLGEDTAICADASLTLDAGNPGAAGYVWNGITGGRTLGLDTIGVYDVVVTTTKGCVGYDTLEFGINALPEPNLGIDSSLCDGDSMALFTGLSDITLLWTPTGEISDTIIVSAANTYEVMVTDTNECVGHDTVIVTVDVVPVVDLGIDSSLCAGDSMVIKAANPGATYLWSNGETTQNITVDSASNYIVTVTNAANCSTNDTIIVTVDSVPVVDLGIDTSICSLDSIVFNAGSPGASHEWSTGELTQTIKVGTANTYSVIVTNSYNCSTKDTVELGIYELPDVDLGPDREVCKYLNIEFGVAEEGAISYLWSNGEITDSISINTPGEYSIEVVSVNNCYDTDTIIVNPGPDLFLSFDRDSVICDGDGTDIDVDVENDRGDLTYSWSTGDEGSSIYTTSTGTYSVLVIDEFGCRGDSLTTVRVQTLPTIELSADTLTMCSLEEADEITTITATNNGSYVEWSDGSVGGEFLADISGFYEAYVYDVFGCNTYDSLTIHEYCRPVRLTLPNTFSPNGDGHNDAFIPFEMAWEDLDYMMANLNYIHFKVYNRWGVLIHSSDGIVPRWKGFDQDGDEAAVATYYWVLEYQDVGGKNYTNNGFVQLQR